MVDLKPLFWFLAIAVTIGGAGLFALGIMLIREMLTP